MSAVQYLHKISILHLDIKPNNIMITRDDEVKLIDFGFARKSVWKENVQCGTAGFIAPEILCQQSGDERSDIFSCGIVFYIMKCGKLPYIASTETLIQRNATCNINPKDEVFQKMSK